MKLKLSPEQQKILQQQTISQTEPGTILRDFERLLEVVASQEIEVSGVRQVLPLTLLGKINAGLSRPLEIGIQRAQQKTYPPINGLYLVLRASGLSRIEQRNGKPVLTLNEEVLSSWRSLNPTERYFTLLETWLIRSNDEIIGDRDPQGPLSRCALFWRRLTEKKSLSVADDKGLERTLKYYPGLHHLALLELFGLVSITSGKAQPGKGWIIQRIRPTAFGNALFVQFALALSAQLEGMMSGLDEEKAAEDAGILQAALKPFFPEWRNHLTLPEPEVRDGLYYFKVSLGKVWRRIAIPSKLTLFDLSRAIQQAVKFDDDHLHMFTYRNQVGLKIEVNHPYSEDLPSTDEVTLGELPLGPGDVMEYIFDFGTWWKFKVDLERIDPPNSKIKKPKLLEQHGKAPEQYPSWDDEDGDVEDDGDDDEE